MTSTPRWRRYLHFWRVDPARDVDDELRFHFESRIADLRARGVPADEAKRQVHAEFGDERATRDRLLAIGRRREERRDRMEWWDAARADLRYAVRGLRSNALLTATIVMTIAIGIGATTAMFGVMHRLLIAPPPQVAAPESLAKVYFRIQPPGADSAVTRSSFSYLFYEQLHGNMRTIAGAAAYMDRPTVVGSGRDAELLEATLTSAGFWSTLGVSPRVGRFPSDEESHPATGARVIVLSHDFWQRHYAGDPAVLGQVVAVKGQPYTIIGVAPRGFRGVELGQPDVWLPLLAYEEGAKQVTWHTQTSNYLLSYVVRLRPGVTRAQVEADLSALHRAHSVDVGLREGRPGPRFAPTTIRLGGLTGALDENMTRIPEATVSIWLVGVAMLLLAIACANVAGLLLLRAFRRRREIAVRLALGMSRRRLAALLFTESALLAVLGAALSVVVIVWGGAWVERVMISGMSGERPGFDWRMLGIAALCTIGVAIVAGLVPLLQIRGDVTAGLREGTQHGSTRRSWMHRGLLVSQVALSMLLLIGAGLFVRSLHRISSLDLGMEVTDVLAIGVDFTGTSRTPDDRLAFFERALERVRALPGVHAASVSAQAPLRGASGASFKLPGAEQPVTSPGGSVPWGNHVSDGFFEATNMRIVRGRGFTSSDRGGAPVIVVNEALAQLAFPGKSPVGECVYTPVAENACTTIVGVVANARTFQIREEQRPWMYHPLAPTKSGSRVLLVRVPPGEADRMTSVVRRTVQEMEPELPYIDVRVLGDVLDPQMRPWRMGATLFTAFGLLAALLAALGLYSAVAYAVTQRTREIGVRLAIGAKVGSVIRLVIGDGVRIAAVGVTLGMLLALAASNRMRDLLFETSPRDPLVLGLVAAGLIVLAGLASLVPARRAARVEPSVALRVE